MTRVPATGVAIAHRPATAEDLAACAEIWHAGITDYERRLNQPELPQDLDPLRQLLGHFLTTDPGLFWVATNEGDTGAPVAFVSALVREHVWFLAMLFVHPDAQAAGIGRALLARVLPAPVPGAPEGTAWAGGITVLGTATDSVQPISNGLYASYGIVPRMPVLNLVGRPDPPGSLPELPSGISAVRFDELAAGPPAGPGHRQLVSTVDALDRATLGYAHPEDHRFLRQIDRTGFLYRGQDGAAVGYGYASPSGRIGPIALLDQDLFPSVLGHLLTVAPPRGASAVRIAGAADRAIVALLRAGFRLEGFPTLLCWTRPFAAFERYVPITLAVL